MFISEIITRWHNLRTWANNNLALYMEARPRCPQAMVLGSVLSINNWGRVSIARTISSSFWLHNSSRLCYCNSKALSEPKKHILIKLKSSLPTVQNLFKERSTLQNLSVRHQRLVRLKHMPEIQTNKNSFLERALELSTPNFKISICSHLSSTSNMW